jgi:hypothetical protein
VLNAKVSAPQEAFVALNGCVIDKTEHHSCNATAALAYCWAWQRLNSFLYKDQACQIAASRMAAAFAQP